MKVRDINMKKYLVVFEKTKTGYSAYVPNLPGCIAIGRTKIETEKNMYEAMQFHLEDLLEEKIKLPKMQAVSEVFVFN
jgi:predicted RNase H-like HicB family nuclease